METVRDVNKHLHSAEHSNYVFEFKNSEEEKPIDLTNNIGYPQQMRPASLHKLDGRGGMPYLQNVDKEEEVMKAAKSLFSKRTRTLYHWMYPNTPKFHLKSAVALAWDTMGPQEKQFYISQVLGKFGYLQNSLMVNPQLGGLNLPVVPTNPPPHPDLNNVETRNAVSNILQDSDWGNGPSVGKRRGRPKGSKKGVVERNRRKRIRAEEEDFTDDPELRKELEQFQWALHMVEK